AASSALSRHDALPISLLLVFAMLVVCQMILMRYVFRAPTIWQSEAVVFGATAAIFLGAPYVLMTKGHVGVDFIQMLVGDRTRLWLDRIGAWLGLGFCILMTAATGLHLFEALEGGWTTSSVAAVPLWMPLTPVVFGFALLSLQYVVEIMKLSGDPS